MAGFNADLIVRRVPKRIMQRTKWYMEERFMGLYDAFKEAVREYPHPSKELHAAFMDDDYRDYIPSAYLPECLSKTRYLNIVSPDICSYRRYKALGEYDTLEEALHAYESDVASWKKDHKGEIYAYATISIKEA